MKERFDGMIDPKLDGIKFVNIYSQGKTELGRMLSNFYPYEINTPYGKFKSVEGYWHWLGIDDCPDKEILRTLYGYQAKQKGTELKKCLPSRFDEEFQKKILDAIWYKVSRKRELFCEPVIRLPFEHYYVFGACVIDVKSKYQWMVDGIDKMRNRIIKERCI